MLSKDEHRVLIKLFLGSVHKGFRTKSLKLISHCPQNIRTGSNISPFCPCGHTINFKNSEVFLRLKVRTSASEEPPLVRKVSVLDHPSPSLDCGRLLWTAPYKKCV